MNVRLFSPQLTPLVTSTGVWDCQASHHAYPTYTPSLKKSEDLVAYPSPPMSDITPPRQPGVLTVQGVTKGDQPAVSVPENREEDTGHAEHIRLEIHAGSARRLSRTTEEATRSHLSSYHRPQLPPLPPLPQTPPASHHRTSILRTPERSSPAARMQIHYGHQQTLPRLGGPQSYNGMNFSPQTYHQYGYHQPPQMQSMPQYFGAPLQLAPQHTPIPQLPVRTHKPARVTKAHVKSACNHCKKAHLSCDDKRPCNRCITTNKIDCHDVPHKKRGRPRLRDDKDKMRHSTSSSSSRPLPPRLDTSTQHYHQDVQQRSNSFGGVLAPRLLPGDSFGTYQSPVSSPGTGTSGVSTHVSPTNSYPFGSSFDQPAKAIVYLNMDLVIMKPNAMFESLYEGKLGGGTVRGRKISEFILYYDLQGLSQELLVERESRDPTYLAPMDPRGVEGALQSIMDVDLDRVTQGFTERTYNWTLSQYSTPFRVSVKLAKTSCYFVAMSFQPTRPLQNQHMFQQGFSGQMAPPAKEKSPASAGHQMAMRYNFWGQNPPSPSASSDSSSPMFSFHNGSMSQASTSSMRSPHFGFNPTPRSGSDASSYMSSMQPPTSASRSGSDASSYMSSMQPPASASSRASYSNFSRSASLADNRMAPSMESSMHGHRHVSTVDNIQLPPLRGNLTPPMLSPGVSDMTGAGQMPVHGYGHHHLQESPLSEKRRGLDIGEILE
ncbi:hypothetical protein EJ05DRAFT_174586 [Pseudovirgaria hyperparasitica]|uniref:Zn(2)-C6 fungal-type domain-containing protein n=1 Tax=Pseudovirgaria hyperparasitica TaxID=470096 RepID=A0A6A6WHP6_9PEZI|nr:uncharacterized protein EJ05DRAFT_174586 [Pseudovirgaria hyperparasitica]KAF2761516.1 hypothetical protein EJ05DRAFT_174586 [Pseudovirgaria hyperparasitica]